MIDEALVDGAIDRVRAVVSADGGDIVLGRVDGDTAHLTLILGDGACAECVMPKDFLERIALDMLSPEVPGLARVAIEDPRETN